MQSSPSGLGFGSRVRVRVRVRAGVSVRVRVRVRAYWRCEGRSERHHSLLHGVGLGLVLGLGVGFNPHSLTHSPRCGLQITQSARHRCSGDGDDREARGDGGEAVVGPVFGVAAAEDLHASAKG